MGGTTLMYPHFPSTISREWNPTILPPLGWWDVSDFKTLTLVGSKVSAIADKSGNGYNCTQGTDANRPVYNATTMALECTAANFTSLQGTYPTFAKKYYTVFAVINHKVISAGTNRACFSYLAANPTFAVLTYPTDVGLFTTVQDSSVHSVTTPAISNRISLVSGKTYKYLDNPNMVRCNRVQVDGTTPTNDTYVLSGSYLEVAIGRSKRNASNTTSGMDATRFFLGDIHEIICFGSDVNGLSLSDISMIETYLISKWRIS